MKTSEVRPDRYIAITRWQMRDREKLEIPPRWKLVHILVFGLANNYDL